MGTKQAAVKEPPADTPSETPAEAGEPKRYPTIWDKLDARFPDAFGPSPDYGVQFATFRAAIATWDAEAEKARDELCTAILPDLDDHYERELVQVHSGTKVTVAEVPVHHETS